MRYALVLLLVGCTTPEVPSYIPACSVAVGVAATATGPVTPDEPTPSDECESCGGQGWLGDGTIKQDCPDCDTPWQQAPQAAPDQTQKVIELLERMDARLAALEARIEQLEQTPAADLTPVPLQSDEDAGVPTAGDPQLASLPQSDSSDGPQAVVAVPAEIQWVTTAEARQSGKPVWLHFTGSRCGPCRTQEANVFTDPDVIAASEDWACVKIVDSHPWLGHYGIRMWPSDVFVTNDGAEVHENTGGRSAAEFVNFLSQ